MSGSVGGDDILSRIVADSLAAEETEKTHGGSEQVQEGRMGAYSVSEGSENPSITSALRNSLERNPSTASTPSSTPPLSPRHSFSVSQSVFGERSASPSLLQVPHPSPAASRRPSFSGSLNEVGGSPSSSLGPALTVKDILSALHSKIIVDKNQEVESVDIENLDAIDESNESKTEAEGFDDSEVFVDSNANDVNQLFEQLQKNICDRVQSRSADKELLDDLGSVFDACQNLGIVTKQVISNIRTAITENLASFTPEVQAKLMAWKSQKLR